MTNFLFADLSCCRTPANFYRTRSSFVVFVNNSELRSLLLHYFGNELQQPYAFPRADRSHRGIFCGPRISTQLDTKTLLHELDSYRLVLRDLENKKSWFVLPLKSFSAENFLAYIDIIAFESIHNETEVHIRKRSEDCNTTWILHNSYGAVAVF